MNNHLHIYRELNSRFRLNTLTLGGSAALKLRGLLPHREVGDLDLLIGGSEWNDNAPFRLFVKALMNLQPVANCYYPYPYQPLGENIHNVKKHYRFKLDGIDICLFVIDTESLNMRRRQYVYKRHSYQTDSVSMIAHAKRQYVDRLARGETNELHKVRQRVNYTSPLLKSLYKHTQDLLLIEAALKENPNITI